MSSNALFQGIYAPIATPFDREGQIDYAALEKNIAFYNQTKLAGLVVLGSNGEFALLSHREKCELVRFVRQKLVASKRIIAGTGCESTQETIELSKECADAGADAVLVVTPWYYKGSYTENVLEAHFSAVADAVPVPLMLYNMPRNTSLNMSAALVTKLSQHKNIVGVKDSGGDIVQMTNIINNTPAGFAVFAGSGSFLMATTVMGGVGGTLAIANIMPDLCVELFEAARDGELTKARQLQQRLMAPNAAVTSGMGISGLKKAMDLIGLCGGAPRLPLQPLSDENTAKLRAILSEAGLNLV